MLSIFHVPLLPLVRLLLAVADVRTRLSTEQCKHGHGCTVVTGSQGDDRVTVTAFDAEA